ncbi:MAG TPA: WYL domain-containing protein [Kofleriaceae bacterium]|nr:WYL domain-containing protein [Kofleriaceae bacterium]
MRAAKSTKRKGGKPEARPAAKAKLKPKAAADKGDKASKADKPAKDDASTRGDRSKRLLDLVMILLRARTPVTYREIRESFPAYQTLNIEAGLRAFERDKADLLDLGVPIRYVTPDEDDSLEDGGYVIDLKRFKMPEVRLTPDEISALVLAASVAHAMPGGTYPKIVDLALKKLAFDLPELPDTPTEFPRPAHNAPTVLVHFPERHLAPTTGSEPRPELGEIYATLEAATRLRKRVTLTYQAATNGLVSRRDLDPYAMVYREGAWLVVGWCHLRHEIRSFRVDRIHEAVQAPKPKSPDFERPADFDVKAYAQRSPWTFTSEPPEEVQLVLTAEAAEVANEDFGPTAVKRHDSDRTLITFDCTNPDFAVSRILASKGAIQVTRGDKLRARIAAELDAIADRYDTYSDVPPAEETAAPSNGHSPLEVIEGSGRDLDA